ncbi:MAG: toll/interleukin-1 receptor domain-containing protein, partial [Gammaproteobacteria bacterium]|nr:toll/interleukin-1 receptor domain-containing protein [Gammaproteobacteria bacterium]
MQRPFPAYQGDEPYVFVSYAHDDAPVVYPEISRLRDQGFNIWYDEGIEPGSSWRDEIALSLSQCSAWLFFVSPRSVVSANCEQELNFALSRERKMLCVHLEPTELPPGMELSLSTKQAIVRADYSQDAYEAKLQASLRAQLPASNPLLSLNVP